MVNAYQINWPSVCYLAGSSHFNPQSVRKIYSFNKKSGREEGAGDIVS